MVESVSDRSSAAEFFKRYNMASIDSLRQNNLIPDEIKTFSINYVDKIEIFDRINGIVAIISVIILCTCAAYFFNNSFVFASSLIGSASVIILFTISNNMQKEAIKEHRVMLSQIRDIRKAYLILQDTSEKLLLEQRQTPDIGDPEREQRTAQLKAENAALRADIAPIQQEMEDNLGESLVDIAGRHWQRRQRT